MNGLDVVKAQIRRLAAGMAHGERESLALTLAEVAAGERVQFLECSRGQLTGWRERPERGGGGGEGLALTDADREHVRRCGLDPDEFMATCGAKDFADYKARKAAYRARKGAA